MRHDFVNDFWQMANYRNESHKNGSRAELNIFLLHDEIWVAAPGNNLGGNKNGRQSPVAFLKSGKSNQISS